MEKISICIPTYNREDYLRRAIECCVFTVENYDICLYIQDNASPDNTESVVKSFGNSNIFYERNERNMGIKYNFNRLVERAQGEYIFFLTDDDYILPGSVKRLLEFLDEYNPDFVSSDMGIFYEKQKIFSTDSACDFTGIADAESVIKIFLHSNVLSRCCYKKSSISGWRMDLRYSNVYPNLVLLMDLIIHKKKICYFNHPLIMHIWENEIYWDVDFGRKLGVKHEDLIDDCRLAIIEILNAARETLGEDLYRQYCWHMFLLDGMVLSELPDDMHFKAKKILMFKKVRNYMLGKAVALKRTILGI